jgi:hypothetical protein
MGPLKDYTREKAPNGAIVSTCVYCLGQMAAKTVKNLDFM